MNKGYSNSNNPNWALCMYREMQRKGYSPYHFTFPLVVKASSVMIYPNYGKEILNGIVKTGFELDVYASTSLYMCLAQIWKQG